MAHQLNFNEQTGEYSFFSVKQKAWHGLGKIVQDYPTAAEAMQYAGLDFEVVKEDLYTTAYNCDSQPMDFTKRIKTHFATIRKDTGDVLGIVGKDYEIVQNRDAFTFFDSIVGGADDIRYETAGALGNGERIFITAKLSDNIQVGKDDPIEQYLFLTTSHDGTGSITVAFTPVRIVCANTLSAAMNSKSHTVRIRHTSNAKERLEQAHKVMGISKKLSGELETIFNHWSKVRITDKEVRRLIEMAMCPNKETRQKLQQGDEPSKVFQNVCNDVFSYAMLNETQKMDTTKGTLFGAYNAVTGYYQNVCNYKDDEAKVKSMLMGGVAAIRTQVAFDLCVDFAKSGADMFLN